METENPPSSPRPDRTVKVLRVVLAIICTIILFLGAWVAYAYLTTPAALRHPTQAHFHFRLQIINDGTPVNFAEDKFQTDFNQDICNAALTKEPAHFHDHLDQFVHIHWNHLTGGLLLKDYGWNFTGGIAGTLGYRFDQLPKIIRVPIHSQALPQPPAGAHYYLYTGDKSDHKQRDWHEFLTSDLRNFFAGTPVEGGQLAKLNDIVGSVVIFAQKDPPSAAQIQDRFDQLIPLPESACAG